MHEATAAWKAIDGAIVGWEPSAAAGHLEIVIRDPLRAEADTVRFLAGVLLEQRGLAGVTFHVRTSQVRCDCCDQMIIPTPSDPVCRYCQTPAPHVTGPAIVITPTPPARMLT